MSTRNILILLSMLCFTWNASLAAEEPNTASVSDESTIQTIEEPKAPGNPLFQSVTYSARRATLNQVLSDLSKQSGVWLIAGKNRSDWRSRDRKITVFVKDQPLYALMNSIAHVTKMTWKKSTQDGVDYYRLYMSEKVRRDAYKQAVYEAEEYQKRQIAKRSQTLDDLAQLSNLTPDAIDELKEKDPWNYMLASTGIARDASAVLSSVPGLADAFAQGQETNLSASMLPESVHNNLLQLFQQVKKMNIALNNGENFNNINPEMPNDLTKVKITVGSYTPSGSNNLLTEMLLGKIAFSFDADANGGRIPFEVELPLFDRKSPLALAYGSMCSNMLQNKPSGQSQISIRLPNEPTPDFGEKVISNPSDAALEVQVKAETKKADPKAKPEKIQEPVSYEDYLALAHESTGFSIVSDAFDTGKQIGLPIPIKLSDMLDITRKFFKINWVRDGNFIELRDRFWFKKIQWQVPEDWLESLRQRFITNGTLYIDDMAEIAKLTKSQFDINFERDPILGQPSLVTYIDVFQEPLHLYALLSNTQRQTAFSKQGLSFNTLNQTQCDIIARLLTKEDPLLLSKVDFKDLILQGTLEPKEKLVSYKLDILMPDRKSTGILWRIVTPENAVKKEALKTQ